MTRCVSSRLASAIRRAAGVLPTFLLACGGTLAPPADASFPEDAEDAPSADALSLVDAGRFEVGPDPADKNCPKAFDCVGCCQDNHDEGITQFIAVIQDCVCEAGPCGEACAYEYCLDMAPAIGDHCDICMTAAVSGVCAGEIASGCAAQEACANYLYCVHRCPADAGG